MRASPRLLVVRMDSIGDMVMMTPALRALRRAVPEARITLMASHAGSHVVPLMPWVDDVVVHRALWQELPDPPPPVLPRLLGEVGSYDDGAPPEPPELYACGPAAALDTELALVDRIWRLQCDAALVFTSFRQSPHVPAYVCHLAGIPVRAAITKEFGGNVVTHAVPPPPDEMHQVDRNMLLLDGIGIPAGERDLELHVPEEADAEAARLLADAGVPGGSPFVVLAPAASCRTRTYPMERFARLAELLLRKAGLPLVVVGRREEAPLISGMGPVLRRLHRVDGKTSLPVLAAVIRRSALLVASHSGPMHIADAMGCPMVILFSGTDLLSQRRPRSAPARILGRPAPCSPCYGLDCPYGLECLDVAPEEAVRACIQLLQAGPIESIQSQEAKGCVLSAS